MRSAALREMVEFNKRLALQRRQNHSTLHDRQTKVATLHFLLHAFGLKELSHGCLRMGELTRSKQKVAIIPWRVQGVAIARNHHLRKKTGDWRARDDCLVYTICPHGDAFEYQLRIQ